MQKVPALIFAGGILAGSLATASIGTTQAAEETDNQGAESVICERRGPTPEVKAALEAKDFQAFQAALPDDAPLAGTIDTQEKFDQFLQMHELRKSGDRKGAKAIADELGLKPPKHRRHGHDGHGGKRMLSDHAEYPTAQAS